MITLPLLKEIEIKVDQAKIKFTPAKYKDLMKISVAFLILLFPSVALPDYVSSGSSISEYRVYDESIKTDAALVDEDHINDLIVTYYVRITSKPKIDMYGNKKSETSVMQFAFNCATKFYGVRANEFIKFTDGEYSLPDSLGRKAGNYACAYHAKTNKLKRH